MGLRSSAGSVSIGGTWSGRAEGWAAVCVCVVVGAVGSVLEGRHLLVVHHVVVLLGPGAPLVDDRVCADELLLQLLWRLLAQEDRLDHAVGRVRQSRDLRAVRVRWGWGWWLGRGARGWGWGVGLVVRSGSGFGSLGVQAGGKGWGYWVLGAGC